MTFYLDSADPEEISRAQNWDFIAGFTTNPLLMAKTLRKLGKTPADYFSHLKLLAEILYAGQNRPTHRQEAGSGQAFFVQPLADTPEGMVQEAGQIREIFPQHLILKIPFTPEGLTAAREIKNRNWPFAFTAVFSPLQAQIAAECRAEMVIPFCHRVGKLAVDGVKMIGEIVELFQARQIKSRLLAASLKSQPEVLGVLALGVEAVTLPFGLYREIFEHPLSLEATSLFTKALKPE